MIEIGATAERMWTVESRHLATAHGSGDVDVLATPALIAFCEETARELVAPNLPEEQTTVGTSVEMQHTAATPPGLSVSVTAQLVDVDGRRLRFDLVARDEAEEIGRGCHERFIVDRERFESKVAAKRGSKAA